MRYLFRIFPIPDRWWVKFLLGSGWIAESQAEVVFGFSFLPKFLIQIIGPVDIILAVSTFYAAICGALHFSLGIVQAYRLFKDRTGDIGFLVIVGSGFTIVLLLLYAATLVLPK